MKKKISTWFLIATMILTFTIPAQAQTTLTEEITVSATNSVKNSAAQTEYRKFLRSHHKGSYYAIVNAGYKKAPVLIVTASHSYLSGSVATPAYGYPIRLYTYSNGKVKCLSKMITQSMSAGPWFLYKNKLVTCGRRDGIYTLNIYKSSFTRTFNASGATSAFAQRAKVIKLRKN